MTVETGTQKISDHGQIATAHPKPSKRSDGHIVPKAKQKTAIEVSMIPPPASRYCIDDDMLKHEIVNKIPYENPLPPWSS